ncbi:MAG: gliding motility-associated C-terminal domain-containing protein, partial [Bacteroidota bacterium]
CIETTTKVITVQRVPEAEVRGPGGELSFFSFCTTDGAAARTITATQTTVPTVPGVTYDWYRLQHFEDGDGNQLELDYDAMVTRIATKVADGTLLSDMELVAPMSGNTLVISDWGWYLATIKEGASECFSLSNIVFANTAIAEIVNQEPSICDVSGDLDLIGFSPHNDTYQWAFSDNQTGPWADIAGATSRELNLTTPGDVEGYYRLTVTFGSCPPDVSDPVFVSQDQQYTGTISAEADYACQNGTVRLNSVVSNAAAERSWQRSSDGINFSNTGESGSTFNATGNSFYRMQVSNGACLTNSNQLFIREEASPGTGVSYNEPDPDFCSPVTITLDDNDPDYTFQWLYTLDTVNITTLSGATSSEYTTSDQGYYFVRITDEFGCTSNSDSTFLFGNINTEISGTGDLANACLAGDTVTLELENRVILSYDWFYTTDTTLGFSAAPDVNDASSYEVYQEGFYRATISNGDCEADSEIVQAFEAPEVTISGPAGTADFFYCPDNAAASRTLNATDAGMTGAVTFTWQRYRDESQTPDQVKAQVAASPGSFTYDSIGTGASFEVMGQDWGAYRSLITANASGCTATSDVIFANTTLADIVQDSSALCPSGDTLVLSSFISNNDTYQWEYAGSDQVFSDMTGESNDTLQLTTPGNLAGFYRFVSVRSGCSAVSDTVSIALRSIEAPTVALTDLEICSNDSTTLTATLPAGATSFSWQYSTDGTSFNDLSETSSSFFVNTAGRYKVSAVVDGCTTESNTVQLNATPAPGSAVTYTPATTNFCDPVEIALVDQDSTYQYQWYFFQDTADVQSIDGEMGPAYTASAAGSYFARIENTAGCQSNSDTTTLRTQINPAITNVDSAAFLCAVGASVVLETTNDATLTYQWLFAADTSFAPAAGDSTSATYLAGEAGLYKVQVSNGVCSEESEPVRLTLDTTRVEGFAASIEGSSRACDDTPILYSSTYQDDAATFQWQYRMGTESFQLVDESDAEWQTSLSALDESVQSTYDLTVRMTVSANGCVGTSDEFNTVIYRSPDIEALRLQDNSANDFVYCQDDLPVDRRLVTRQGDTDYFDLIYQWELKNAAGQFDTIAEAVENTFTLSRERGFVRVTAAIPDFESCQRTSNEIFVQTPSDRFLEDDVFLCESHPEGLLRADELASDTLLTDVTYRWLYSADGASFSEVGGELTESLVIGSASTGLSGGQYFFEATQASCTVASDTIEVSIRPNTPFSFVSTDEFCSNSGEGSLAIVIDNPSDFTFALDSIAFVASPVFDSLNRGEYLLSVLDSAGCVTSQVAEVLAVNNFEVFLEPDTLLIQQGLPFELEASGAVDYEWYPVEFIQRESGPQVTAFVPPDAADTVSIYVQGTSPEACLAVDSILLIQERTAIEDFEPDDLVFSKVISPNGDLVNDDFEVIGLPENLDNTLQVLDKWGKVIFSADNYQAGTVQSKVLSDRLKEGTYFFLLKTPQFSRKGFFQVVR